MNNKVLEKAIVAVADGDMNALLIIFDESEKYIFSVAYSILRSYQDAEDVSQDTYIKIASNARSFLNKRGDSAKAWILSITRNLSLDLIRSRKRKQTLSFDEPMLSESSFLSKNDDYSHLEVFEMLNRLNEDERQVVTYRLYAKMSHKEIAAVMGITNASAQKKYQRAIKKLRKEYDEHEKYERIRSQESAAPIRQHSTSE
jgi:RNA polymerase sigma-70 factor (ECF subfamily)